MLRGVLNVAGWLFLLFAILMVILRFTEATTALSHRNQVRASDLGALAFAFGLIFLALAAIISRLDALLEKREK